MQHLLHSIRPCSTHLVSVEVSHTWPPWNPGIIISLRVLTWGSSGDGSRCTAQLPTAGEKPPSLRKGWREDLSFVAVASSSPFPTPPQTGHLFLLLNWSSCSQKQDELDKGTLSSQGPQWAVWVAGSRGAETGALPSDYSPEPRLQTCLSALPHSLCAPLLTPGAAFVSAFVLATGQS